MQPTRHRLAIDISEDERRDLYELFDNFHGMQTRVCQATITALIEAMKDDPTEVMAAALQGRLEVRVVNHQRP